jgi:hypothetical protein
MTNTLLARTLAELSDRYTGLPDDYRRYVRMADAATLERIYELAVADAPGREIAALLGYQTED